jgi:hypothetical protein
MLQRSALDITLAATLAAVVAAAVGAAGLRVARDYSLRAHKTVIRA